MFFLAPSFSENQSNSLMKCVSRWIVGRQEGFCFEEVAFQETPNCYWPLRPLWHLWKLYAQQSLRLVTFWIPSKAVNTKGSFFFFSLYGPQDWKWKRRQLRVSLWCRWRSDERRENDAVFILREKGHKYNPSWWRQRLLFSQKVKSFHSWLKAAGNWSDEMINWGCGEEVKCENTRERVKRNRFHGAGFNYLALNFIDDKHVERKTKHFSKDFRVGRNLVCVFVGET